MEGHGAKSLGLYLLTLPFYFVTVFVSFFPWSIKLPWLIRRLWRKQETGVSDPGYSNGDKIDKYLLTGIAIIFLIFTLIKTKLPHYTLPAFPLLALLLARRWFAEKMPTAFLKRTAAIVACVYLALALLVAPFTASFFPSRELFRKSRDYLKPEMKFAALDYKEPSLVWYFRSRVREFMRTWQMHPGAVQPFMEQTGPRFVILPTDVANKIYPRLPNNWKSFSTRGFNAVKGKRSDLTLILKPE